MKRTYRSWLVCGMAASTAVWAATILARRARARRQALARQVNEVTRHAVGRLGVRAQSQFLHVNEVGLHSVVAGPPAGPLVVLLHGFPECWYSWQHQIPALARAGYRVVVPDQRGYNLSDKPAGAHNYQIDQLTGDVRDLIQAMGRERATLVGHDWGGVVAWRFAMDYPDMVDKLVVMNAPHPVTFMQALKNDPVQQRKSWYIFLFQIPWLPETLLGFQPASTAQLFFQRTVVRAGAFTAADQEVMAAAMAQGGALRAMINWYRAAFRYRAAQKSRAIEKPSLLIWAEDDIALGKSLTYGLVERVPNLVVHYIPHCGHWVQNEAPDEVNTQLLAFLGSDKVEPNSLNS